MSVYVGNAAPLPQPEGRRNGSTVDPPGPPPMPFSMRYRLGLELNRAWREFTEEMHDGPLVGPEVAEKFWKFLTR